MLIAAGGGGLFLLLCLIGLVACLCAKKNTAAPEGYAALDGEERTGAAAAAALSADLAVKDRQRQKAHAATRKHAILGMLFVLATGMQV